MSTELKLKELNYTWLAIAMIFIFLMFLAFGCTVSKPSTEEDRLRSYQVIYKWCFLGDSVYRYRSVNGGPFKVINKEKSGMRADKQTCTETRSTTEKY